MSFRETLKELVEEVEGGLGAILMGYDGIAIDEYILAGSDFDISLLAVEYATLMKEIRRTVEVLQSGDFEELAVATGELRVVVRVVNDEFFVVLIIDRDGNYGKGRYLLRRSVPGLRAALS